MEFDTVDDGNDGHSTVLSLDLGVENVAVTSTGEFWKGSELNHWHREFEKRPSSLQQCGTRADHETIQSVGRTETGRYDNFLHTVSKELVAETVKNSCDTITFENLTEIRDRIPNAKQFHAWTFRRLFAYAEYKVEIGDLSVKQVNPAYTSQWCSKCGTTFRENRQTQQRFCFQKCSYEVNADYNAAKNIGLKYLRSAQRSSGGGAPVNSAWTQDVEHEWRLRACRRRWPEQEST